MAKCFLIVYEPLDNLGEKRDYWSSYVNFYEKYWGGPTSPYGVWFGQEYEAFRRALSEHLGIDEEEIEECFFMKDAGGRYLVSPFGSGPNPYLLSSENYIPEEWFILFKGGERESFYTHWGFGGIHYDTKISLSLERLKEADEIIRKALQRYENTKSTLPILYKLREIQSRVHEFQRWLSGFDPSGYLILNYAEISSFIHPYTLKNENSAEEIWYTLSLIDKGQIEEAGSALNILIQKWDDIRRKASGEIDKSTIQ
ncbi:MAG TPA: hypothetical protein VHT73_03340 [Thermodesulfobacteriota bacterium]|nr:hypothetical protein [Thermodesulfobacteriota bacterium]